MKTELNLFRMRILPFILIGIAMLSVGCQKGNGYEKVIVPPVNPSELISVGAPVYVMPNCMTRLNYKTEVYEKPLGIPISLDVLVPEVLNGNEVVITNPSYTSTFDATGNSTQWGFGNVYRVGKNNVGFFYQYTKGVTVVSTDTNQIYCIPVSGKVAERTNYDCTTCVKVIIKNSDGTSSIVNSSAAGIVPVVPK
ncbi:MAG: hypothetical protein Q7R95_03485 [bacterium]|nr:hypothetical protein [bacterium]